MSKETTDGACVCGACEMCSRRAALDLDDLRETAARLASHAGLIDLSARAFTADFATCAKIIGTSSGVLAVMLVGVEEAAAGALVRGNELASRAGPEAVPRINAHARRIAGGERVSAFDRKLGAS